MEEALANGDTADRDDVGVAIRRDGLASAQADLEKRIDSAPAHVMKQSGLAAVRGGAHVQVFSADPQEVFLPIPQIADGQVPLCYFIRCTPPEAATEFRLRKRDDGNISVHVRLEGKPQDIRIAWSSIVLVSPTRVTPNGTPVDPYRKATECVQSGADSIKKLAEALWPKSGKASEFAANIQQHIQKMKATAQPRSFDALGILKSGHNGICTANANLATALMRSKGIACRSTAVVPPISRRLEMHRIVEFAEDGRWIPFDPSSVSRDIPAKPWQNIIVAKTSIRDEETAMKPRMSVMTGCPFGQEIEMLTPGVALFGEDMFWTEAKPLAELASTDELNRRAAEAWNRYLETGTLTEGQRKWAGAATAKELIELMTAN